MSFWANTTNGTTWRSAAKRGSGAGQACSRCCASAADGAKSWAPHPNERADYEDKDRDERVLLVSLHRELLVCGICEGSAPAR
jgi:hypothetical protein